MCTLILTVIDVRLEVVPERFVRRNHELVDVWLLAVEHLRGRLLCNISQLNINQVIPAILQINHQPSNTS